MERCYRFLFVLFCLLSVFQTQAQTTVIVDNLTPRLDTEGNIVDAHDGRVIWFEDRFYWYGTSYGNTSGFTTANNYVSYSSTDLKSWKYEGELMIDEHRGVYYRPHVIFNEKTKKYILWYNWYPKLWDGKFGVAQSDTPTGPFQIINNDVKVKHSDLGVGDFNIFVDDDHTAYLSYNTIYGHKLSIEKLEKSYLSSTFENGGFITEHCEAGSVFKHNNLYYLLTDYTCCFCTQGSGARVYTSDKPHVNFEYINNINRTEGTPCESLHNNNLSPNEYVEIVKNEKGQFPKLSIAAKEDIPIQKLNIYYFTGNRDGICGDTLAERTHELITIPELSIFDYNGEKIVTERKIERTTAFYKEVSYKLVKSCSEVTIGFDSTYLRDKFFLQEIVINNQPEIQSDIYLLNMDTWHTRPIIPAQQTYVMRIPTELGNKYIWMGDMWGSASDDIKGHDYQYWSAPMQFDLKGHILPLKWVNSWKLEMKTN